MFPHCDEVEITEGFVPFLTVTRQSLHVIVITHINDAAKPKSIRGTPLCNIDRFEPVCHPSYNVAKRRETLQTQTTSNPCASSTKSDFHGRQPKFHWSPATALIDRGNGSACEGTNS